MKVSLQLNNFAVRKQNNLNSHIKRSDNAAVFQNVQTMQKDSVNFTGFLQDKKRGRLAQSIYQNTAAFGREIDNSDRFVQKKYAFNFTEKVTELSRKVATRNGHSVISQKDREDAIRQNLKYLLTDPEMTDCYKGYYPEDANGNSLPRTPLDFQNYVVGFIRINESKFRKNNAADASDKEIYKALVKVLKEDFKPMSNNNNRVLNHWQKRMKTTLRDDLLNKGYNFPVDELRSALRSHDSLDCYMRTELALYSKYVRNDEGEQPELKSMFIHDDCEQIYYWTSGLEDLLNEFS